MAPPSKIAQAIAYPTLARREVPPRPLSQPAQPRRKSLMRKYEVASLSPDGSIRHSEHIAPARKEFESAFAGFTHGTMIATPNGPRAVEDIDPGVMIETAQGHTMPVQWVGRMMLVPTAPVEDPEQLRLTRIMADSFGLSRPSHDLVLGHGARLLRSPAALREYAMQTDILTPAWAFVDGASAIAISPPAPVALYHLALPHHAIIRAAGLEVESYHPGTSLLRDLGHNARTLFLSLFPHITQEDEFGPLSYSRATQNTLEQLNLI